MHPETKTKYKVTLELTVGEGDRVRSRLIHRDLASIKFKDQVHKQKISLSTIRKFVIWLDILENKTLRSKLEQPTYFLWDEFMECVRQIHKAYCYYYFDDRIYQITQKITHRDLFS